MVRRQFLQFFIFAIRETSHKIRTADTNDVLQNDQLQAAFLNILFVILIGRNRPDRPP